MLGRIALDLTKDANQKRRIQAAIQLAAHHTAELIGVCTDPPTPQYMYGGGGVPEQILTMLLNRITQEKAKPKSVF